MDSFPLFSLDWMKGQRNFFSVFKRITTDYFFQFLTLFYMVKILSCYFFSNFPGQIIFFSQNSASNYLFRKNHAHPSFKLNGRFLIIILNLWTLQSEEHSKWNTEKNIPRYVVYQNSKLTNENIQNY